jgi:hypothetical protein
MNIRRCPGRLQGGGVEVSRSAGGRVASGDGSEFVAQGRVNRPRRALAHHRTALIVSSPADPSSMTPRRTSEFGPPTDGNSIFPRWNVSIRTNTYFSSGPPGFRAKQEPPAEESRGILDDGGQERGGGGRLAHLILRDGWPPAASPVVTAQSDSRQDALAARIIPSPRRCRESRCRCRRRVGCAASPGGARAARTRSRRAAGP